METSISAKRKKKAHSIKDMKSRLKWSDSYKLWYTDAGNTIIYIDESKVDLRYNNTYRRPSPSETPSVTRRNV